MRTKSKLSTTTEAASSPRPRGRMKPVHPGEMLLQEFMVPLGLSASALALALRVPASRIGEIVNERRGISGDTALRLGRYFHMGPEFWMNLQKHYELELARDAKDVIKINTIEPAPIGKDGVLLARSA